MNDCISKSMIGNPCRCCERRETPCASPVVSFPALPIDEDDEAVVGAAIGRVLAAHETRPMQPRPSEAKPIGVGACKAADTFICEWSDCPVHGEENGGRPAPGEAQALAVACWYCTASAGDACFNLADMSPAETHADRATGGPFAKRRERDQACTSSESGSGSSLASAPSASGSRAGSTTASPKASPAPSDIGRVSEWLRERGDRRADDAFTVGTMADLFAYVRATTIEACAKECDDEVTEWEGEDARAAAESCAVRLRDLAALSVAR